MDICKYPIANKRTLSVSNSG